MIRSDYGAFCQQRSVGEVEAPGTAAAKVDLLPDVPVIQWPTQRIPLLPGVSFGVRSETPNDITYDPVLIELIHPPFTLSGIKRQSYLTTLGGEGGSINAYSFDLLEEMVPGAWTIRALHNGVTLYEVTFDIVDPALAPGIGMDCEGQNIS